ncbi:glycosyltransferase [Hanstruepera neustonica]|uniref:Glycosyltransferase n=1 Tax=Hanstruepera neustonica TaxID=1445657 RepID=A0A2K1E479_9FLAO|nr:glycosyltransferase [Hanstruepera neustonica]PNQ75089.1 glycosyltransferase [Hanstruepera neustonica]
MSEKKRILVAPLNWGLGHATRCIPIIKALEENHFEPVIASDGVALELLKREFPDLLCLSLPSYNITYSKKGSRFKYKILKDSPKILKNIKAERQATANIIANHNIAGIISDNRFGVFNKNIPCVFMTHQLQVLSGSTTWFSTKMHQKIIKKFDECWVPDNRDKPNLSSKLGHVESIDVKLKYIGPISRFNKLETPIVYDIMVLLSGPEPQRTLLEEKLSSELSHYSGKVLFVKGLVDGDIKKDIRNHITYYNYLTSDILETAINESNLVISRSGYTTIMDLAKLGKQAFFIPTPGQFEQEYLAKTLHKNRIVPSCSQDEFSLNKLELGKDFRGLDTFQYDINYKNLFSLFHTE